MGAPELINRKDKIGFLYKAIKVRFDDKTKVEDYFKCDPYPIIIVNEIDNLIGG